MNALIAVPVFLNVLLMQSSLILMFHARQEYLPTTSVAMISVDDYGFIEGANAKLWILRKFFDHSNDRFLGWVGVIVKNENEFSFRRIEAEIVGFDTKVFSGFDQADPRKPSLDFFFASIGGAVVNHDGFPIGIFDLFDFAK